jgi:hypothetical protein
LRFPSKNDVHPTSCPDDVGIPEEFVQGFANWHILKRRAMIGGIQSDTGIIDDEYFLFFLQFLDFLADGLTISET